MAIIHDLRCTGCGIIMEDVVVDGNDARPHCPDCGQTMETYYGIWQKGLGLVNDGVSVNDRTARDGTISSLGASDSKLCRIEMGLDSNPHNKTLRTTTPEQAAHLRAKMMEAGKDAVKNRAVLDETLSIRKANEAARK